MLGQIASGVVFGRRAEDGEDKRDAAADRLGAGKVSGGGEEELLAAGTAPGRDGGAVEIDLHGITAWELCGYNIVLEGYGGLGE